MIIAEIGVNFLGNRKLLRKYIYNLNKTNIDAITIQIFSKNYYLKNKIKQSIYIEEENILFDLLKYSKKKIGITTDCFNEIWFKNIALKKINFLKILGSQVKDKGNHKIIFNLKKKIFISNRGLNYDEEKYLVKKVKKNNYLNLIHTQKNPKINFSNLNNIAKLKKKAGLDKISFGLHCNNHSVLYQSVLFNPKNIFFYIKEGKLNTIYPDDEHAILLKDVDKVIDQLNFVKKYTTRN